MKLVEYSKINGTIKAPSSKSDMQRAVAAATLCAIKGGEVTITNPSFCDDSKAALNIALNLGAESASTPDKVVLFKGARKPNPILDCNESGLCMRMFSAVASVMDLSDTGSYITIMGKGGLKERPVSMIEAPLTTLGAKVVTNNGFLPVKIQGPIKPGIVEIDGSITSQFLSGLLIVLPTLKGDSQIIVKNLKSKPYISMTLDLMNKFGVSVENQNFEKFIVKGNQEYKSITCNIDGDWSGTAFILVAGALTGSVKVENIKYEGSYQGDKAIIEVLKLAGANVNIFDNYVEVSQNNLKAFEFDATDCPDLFPPLAVLAANCKGTSKIKGIHRLAHKESDRFKALLTEFEKFGIVLKSEDDYMVIEGCNKGNPDDKLNGGFIAESYDDHRIAMACTVLGIKAKFGVKIKNPECVNKSYPEFFDHMIKLGANIK